MPTTQQNNDDDDDDNDYEGTTTFKKTQPTTVTNADEDKDQQRKLAKYHTEQQLLYQLRSTYLTEILASRGVTTLPTLASVSTSDSQKMPELVDWDCALSTDAEPRSCLYSFDAQPYTKVVAPRGTDQWISLSALNRLRRTDATKVEPMWHSRYSILNGWFGESSKFCMLQYVGTKGFFVSSVLLDGGNGMVLRSLLVLTALLALIVLLPIIEYVVGRVLVSAPFWSQWSMWGRILRAGFPLKLLLGQMAWKGVASGFSKVESAVREYIVDVECEILEDCVPVTVGVTGSDGEGEGNDEYDEDASYDDDY